MTISVYPPYGAQSNPSYVAFDGTNTDAFGRLRTSEPYTLFDSQSRFASDPQYSYVNATGGGSSYNTNKSSTSLTVTSTSGSTSIAQTRRVFPYQPGKGLLTLQTFTFAAAKTNLVQRIGYYSAYNGVYLEQGANGVTFVIRTYTSGSVDNTRYVPQADWNGDKLNGTGASGITLDLTKTNILWMDFEWLGVGQVRCGFIIEGQYIVCHTFYNANIGTNVYMQTAILPLRAEVFNSGATSGSSTLQLICSTVICEGGYEQQSQNYIARRTTNVNVGTTFIPLVSIRVNSSYYGAIVIPANYEFLPVGTGSYEIALVRNGTLTNDTWASTMCSGQVDIDTAATAITIPAAENIVRQNYTTSTNQSSVPTSAVSAYNFQLQLGYTASTTGNGFASSDIYTLVARTMTGTNDCIGALSFWNLTV